jgi:TetR/AcrR family transcriptional regulator, tetracycline repressor protein
MGRSRGPGIRAGLTSEQVLAEAVALVEEHGAEALTMRRLADRLGVAPNALYSHVPDKSTLLDAVLDTLLAEIEVRGLRTMEWRDGLGALMTASRAMLLRHVPLLPHLLTRPMTGPNASRLGEETLALLERGGVEGETAVRGLRALLAYTFGSVVMDAPRYRDPDPAARQAAGRAAFASRSHLPTVSRLAEPLSRPPSEEVFQAGLRWLIEGIAASGTSRPG